MYIISMLLLPVLLLLSGVFRGASAVEPVHTYERQDPHNGKTLICDMCPPGTHMVAHCTATTLTECAPCGDDHYTELWNYLPRCLYCNNFCSGNQEVEQECSAVSNRVCRCKEGFYGSDGFCTGHSECGPGHGVQTQGTSQTDTVCKRCSEGYFSSSLSALDTCVNHQQCANGQIVLLPGSAEHDTVCDSCQDPAGETLRKFLSEFFSVHKMRLAKLKKFVARHIQMSGEEGCTSDTTFPRQRGPLLNQIRAWVAKAPEEQLRKLPQMLRAAELSSMEEKLKKSLDEIKQQNPNCTLTL